MVLLSCEPCQRTYRTRSGVQDRTYYCPKCRGSLRKVESETSSPGSAPPDMPKEASDAACYPTRHLGPFILVGELGQGPLGTVHKAWDTRTGSWIAVKVLRGGTADAEKIDRYRREAAQVTALDHPYIAPVYEVMEVSGRFVVVMKLVEGRTLEQTYLRDARRASPICQVLKYIRDASLGLGYAHGRGLTHLDLKPENLMIDRRGRLFLLDFGLAKVLGRPGVDSDPGRKKGAIAYQSPEQVMGPPPGVDARSDVFSLGATLWTLLVGRNPFQGGSDLETVTAIVRYPVPSLRAFRPDLPGDIDGVVRKAMEKAPDSRYPSGVEFASALNECLAKLETTHASWARPEPIGAPFDPGPVLLIEDDASVAALLRTALERDGLEIRHFADGKRAMEAAEEASPGVVLLDLKLPGMSGWEILRRLRSLPAYEHVPIMIITAEGSEESVVRAFQLGADDYLVKPFSVALLRSRVGRQALRRAVMA